MQMMLNKGIYGSNSERGTIRPDTLFSANTVTLFTTKVTGLGYNNSRALGWDTKPEPTHYPPPCSERFSGDSFGHTGYTGTSLWCDREKSLIVIFLTNRVYPKRGNEAILEVRPKVHEEVCKILGY